MGFRRPSKNNVPTVENRSPGSDFMRGLMADIEKGIVIPIISNAMRIEQIFRDEQALMDQVSDAFDFSDQGSSFEEMMTRDWADSIGYPMGDDSNLPRVAQYYELEQKEPLQAKTNYLRFVTNYLLDSIEADPNSSWRRKGKFSDLVTELHYPTFPQDMEDPLRILAKMPFKIYITTSYYTFIEQALTAEEKEPQTEVCFWSRKASDGDNKLNLSQFTEKKPLVYHLFGLEDYPDTLVLSEDDYMNFLIMILNEGKFNGKQILSKESVAEMQRDRVTKDVVVKYTPEEAGNWGYGFGEWVMHDKTNDKRSIGVSSPGLFGSFPWVDHDKKYCGFLFTMNIKNKGRNERYMELKRLVDEAVGR